MWDNEESKNISGNKSRKHSVRLRVDIYGVCLSYLIFYLIYDIVTILTPFFARFVTSLTPGARSSGIIGHQDLIQKRTSNKMNGLGKGC